jgi:hypothetical protein
LGPGVPCLHPKNPEDVFEQEIKTYLTSQHISFTDNTRDVGALDFFLPSFNVYFDAKEKRKQFSMHNWREANTPQEYFFIVDDLAVRKMLYHAPDSFCLIRDSSASPAMYYVYSIVDFLCIPKRRVRRPIKRTVLAFKGKWLVDLRDAACFDELADAVKYMTVYRRKHKTIFEEHIDCWGSYRSEKIPKSGTTRTAAYWKEDAKAHE